MNLNPDTPPPAPPSPSHSPGVAPVVVAARERWRLFCGWGGAALVLVAAIRLWLWPMFPVNGLEWENGGLRWWLNPIEHNVEFRWQAGSPALTGLAFASATQGWVCTDTGLILATTNGGKTWEKQSTGIEDARGSLLALHFSSPQSGFAVGRDMTLLSTTTGGATWTRVPLTTSHQRERPNFHAIDFADRNFGVIAGDPICFVTVDGGKTWLEIAEERRAPQKAAQAGPRGSGNFFAVPAPMPAQQQARQMLEYPAVAPILFAANSVNFVSSRFAWLAGNNGQLYARIGETGWTPKPVNVNEHFNAIRFRDEQRGWIVGNRGTFLATIDGGTTWHRQVSGLQADLTAIEFADAQHGWVAGRRGTILVTTDGGASWSLQKSGTAESLRGVRFVNAQNGWAVGTGGTLLATTNGGRTWERRAVYRWYPPPILWLGAAVGLVGLVASAAAPVAKRRTTRSIEDIFVSDSPLRRASDAPEWMRQLTRGLANYLGNPRTAAPVTIAITGDWGRGKSSVMELMRAELARNGHRPVVFNAWHHQDAGNVLAALIGAVREQAIPAPVTFPQHPPFVSFGGVAYYFRLGLRRAQRMWIQVLVLTGLLALSVTWLSFNWSRIVELDLPNGSHDWVDVVTGLLALAAGVAPVAKLLQLLRAFGIDPAKITAGGSDGKGNTRDETNVFRTRFAIEFAEVTEALGPGCRMVIFIDDLDRCEPKHLLQVLEATNFLNSSGQCFIVLGMQRESVRACLRNVLSDGQLWPDKNPDHWLEKLVQIYVEVPRDDDVLRRLLPGAAAPDTPEQRWRPWRQAVLTLLAALAVTGLGWLGYTAGKSVALTIKPPERGGVAIKVDVPAAFAGMEPESPPWQLSGTYQPGQTLALRLSEPPKPKQDVKQEPAETRQVKATQGFVARQSERRASLTAVGADAPADTSETLLAGTGVVTVIAFVLLIVALNRRYRQTNSDSREFCDAVLAWKPALANACDTPRELKRVLNRMRFDAMLVRALVPDKDEPNAEDRVTNREAQIVTLAALERCWPEVFDQANQRLPERLRAGMSREVAMDLQQRIDAALHLYGSGELEAFRKFKDSIRLSRARVSDVRTPNRNAEPM